MLLGFLFRRSHFKINCEIMRHTVSLLYSQKYTKTGDLVKYYYPHYCFFTHYFLGRTWKTGLLLDYGCISVVEHLPSMLEVLSSIPSISKKERGEKRKEDTSLSTKNFQMKIEI
jgi:hypothetical protein